MKAASAGCLHKKMKDKNSLLLCFTFLLQIEVSYACLNFEWSSEGLTEYVHVTEIDEQDELFIEELDSEFYFEQYEGNGSSKTLDILRSVFSQGKLTTAKTRFSVVKISNRSIETLTDQRCLTVIISLLKFVQSVIWLTEPK